MRRLIGPVVYVASLALSGCLLSSPPVEIVHAQTGETVVTVRRAETFEEISTRVYGNPDAGGALAVLAGLPEDEPVPKGTVLIAPPPEELSIRLNRAERARAEFEAGLEAAERSEDLRAAEHFREALRLDPKRDDVRFNLGLALMNAGESREALRVLEDVAQRRPDHADSRYALGAALLRLRAYDRAAEEFEAALSIEPDDVEAIYALGRTRHAMGDTDEASRLFREILRRFPDDPLADSARRWLAKAAEDSVGPTVTPQP